MKTPFYLSLLMSFVVCLNLAHAQNQPLIVYDDVPEREASEHYACRVKRDDESGKWQKAFVLQTKAPEQTIECQDRNNNDDPEDDCINEGGYYDNLRGWTASWIAFESDFEYPVVVEIAKKDGMAITEAVVRPAGAVSNVEVRDDKAYVTFYRPANVNVDINGQMEGQYTGMEYTGDKIHTISLFGNPIYPIPNTSDDGVYKLEPGKDIPDRSEVDWHTIYFEPGVHDIGSPFIIENNETLYIPGDAVVRGTIHPVEEKPSNVDEHETWWQSSAEGFTVYGSGTISGEKNEWNGDGIFENKTFTYQAANVVLEGFVVIDPANHTFNMNNKYDNPAQLNRYKNLKILGWRQNSDAINAFRHSVVSDCFFRVQDDVFYYGENVKMSDIVTWNDANGAVVYLTKGTPQVTDSYIRDISVIYHRSKWHYWDGGRIISMRETPSYKKDKGKDISNVRISNITVTDPHPAFPPFFGTMLEDVDATAKQEERLTLENIVFENIVQYHDGVRRQGDNLKDKDLGPNAITGKPQNYLKGAGEDEWETWRNITFKNCEFNGIRLTSFEDGDFYINQYVDENTVIFVEEVKDSVEIKYVPDQVVRGEPATVQIAYTTDEERDLLVYFQDITDWNDWNDLGVRFDLPPSLRGSLSVDLNINDETPILNDGYRLSVAIVPDGDQWPERLSTHRSEKMSVVPRDKVFKVYPAPSKVTQGDKIKLSVELEANGPRGLHINLQGNGKLDWYSYGYKVISVGEAGIYHFDVELDVMNDIKPADDAYVLSAFLTTPDGSFPDRVSNVFKINDIDADSATLLTTSYANQDGAVTVLDGEGDILIYPNPAQGLLHLEFSEGMKRKIDILNTAGQELYEIETEGQNAQIDVGALNVSGLVLVRIRSAHETKTYKVLVE